jgi:Flp pilus assembly protein TadG
MRTRPPCRRAATAVEMAIIGTVFFMVLIGIVAGAVLMFEYQQVSAVAREGARYASVHGGQYAADTGKTAASSTDIFNNAIAPASGGLNLSSSNVTVNLKTYTVSEDADSGTATVTPVTQDWDSSDKYPFVVTGTNGVQQSTSVVVTITYSIASDLFGGMTFQVTSEIPMSY